MQYPLAGVRPSAPSAASTRHAQVRPHAVSSFLSRLFFQAEAILRIALIFDWELEADTAATGYSNQVAYDKVVANGTVSGTSAFTIALGRNAFTNAFWDTNKS